MRKKISEYELILLDMDGTLYYQRPLQLCMGLWMIKNALFAKGGMKELKTVLAFRKLREHWEGSDNVDTKQYEMLAKEQNMSAEKVQAAVQKWIYELPLRYLARFADKTLITYAKEWMAAGKKVAVYSDYPSEDKQSVLGIAEIAGFYGGQKEIGALKPAPDGILYIMEAYGVQDKSKVLMIGDRMCKDGEAAIGADVDYLILKKHKFLRKRQYENLPM